MLKLLTKERVDYIYKNRLRIIQSSERLAFSIDSVLLAQFVSVKRTKGKMADLCSGNGVIPLVLAGRSRVPITAVEIQPDVASMAIRSVKMNGFSDQIEVFTDDLKRIPEKMERGHYDVITCNPPYYQGSLKNENDKLTMARHEGSCTIEDVTKASSHLLKQKGKAAFVYRPERLRDLFTACEKVGLEPKRMQLVHPKEEAQANIVLLEAVKGGKSGLTMLPPIIVYDGDRQHTKTFQKAYEGDLIYHERKPQEKTGKHYVYMLRCGDRSLYTGYAASVWERLARHEEGKGAKYTRGRGPFTLVHMEAFATKREALQEEWRLKQLTQAQKKAYILERRRGVYANGHVIPRSYTDWKP